MVRVLNCQAGGWGSILTFVKYFFFIYFFNNLSLAFFQCFLDQLIKEKFCTVNFPSYDILIEKNDEYDTKDVVTSKIIVERSGEIELHSVFFYKHQLNFL